jgi:hypothetical protein
MSTMALYVERYELRQNNQGFDKEAIIKAGYNRMYDIVIIGGGPVSIQSV